MSANDNVIPFPGRWHGDVDDEHGSDDHGSAAPAASDPDLPDTGDARDAGDAGGTDFVAQLFAEVMDPGRPSPFAEAGEGAEDPRRTPVLAAPPAEVATLQVRVELDGSDPLVWRLLELPGDTHLHELHDILQGAMGWQGSHLHAFTAGHGGPAHASMPFITDFDEAEGGVGVHESDVRLDQLLREIGDHLYYDYDFGDGWEHTLTLVSTRPRGEDGPAPHCLDGAHACPPEDCGGIGGFGQILEALATPHRDRQEHHFELIDWLPRGYAPDAFSVDSTNTTLEMILGASPPPDAESLAPAFRNLLRRCTWGPHSPLTRLTTAASLGAEDLPGPEVRASMVRPFLHLLELIGDGMPLTGAGYLKPTVVQALVEPMDDTAIWGKANREEHTLPVANLRRAATALGLVRKTKGTLFRTRAAQRIGGDADLLWEHIAAGLPLGKQEAAEHAGVIALLATAAGQSAHEVLRTTGNDIMNEAGWRVTTDNRLLQSSMAFECARPTVEALGALSAIGRRHRDPVLPGGRELARHILRDQSTL